MNIQKKNVINMYKLPEKVIFCKKCTISNQRPRINFDENGICSACNFAEFKKNLYDKYFHADVLKLESLLKKKLNWYD